MSTELYLIGTIHLDFQGMERTQRILNTIKPRRISLEFDSERAKHFNRLQGSLFTELGRNMILNGFRESIPHVNEDTLRKFLPTIDYEYAAATKYSQENKILLFLTDDSCIVKAQVDYLQNNKDSAITALYIRVRAAIFANLGVMLPEIPLSKTMATYYGRRKLRLWETKSIIG